MVMEAIRHDLDGELDAPSAEEVPKLRDAYMGTVAINDSVWVRRKEYKLSLHNTGLLLASHSARDFEDIHGTVMHISETGDTMEVRQFSDQPSETITPDVIHPGFYPYYEYTHRYPLGSGNLPVKSELPVRAIYTNIARID